MRYILQLLGFNCFLKYLKTRDNDVFIQPRKCTNAKYIIKKHTETHNKNVQLSKKARNRVLTLCGKRLFSLKISIFRTFVFKVILFNQSKQSV